jgi:hypothetical protein
MVTINSQALNQVSDREAAHRNKETTVAFLPEQMDSKAFKRKIKRKRLLQYA